MTTSTAETTVLDLAGNVEYANEITGEINAPWYVEYGEDPECVDNSTPAVLVWNENLTWHLEHYPEYIKPMLAENGLSLTAEAEEIATAIIAGHLPGVEISEGFTDSLDTPFFSLEFSVNTPNGFNTPLSVVHESVHNPVAVMNNLTDPGTFGWEYLFGETHRRWVAMQDEKATVNA